MKRKIKNGLLIAISSVVVIAIAVVANMLISAVPDEYTGFDVSGKDIYKLSEGTEDMIRALDEDITFYLVARENMEDTTILEFLKRYERLNSRISVEIIDPEVTPYFTTENGTQHDLMSLNYENSLIVSGEKKDCEVLYENSVIVSGEEILYQDYTDAVYTVEYTDQDIMMYQYTGQMPAGTRYFVAEQSFNSTIDEITSDILPKVYTLTGHGETAIGTSLAGYLKTDNYETAELSLLTGGGAVPEDADCVVINAPASDITVNELEELKKYVDEGGKLILLTGYNYMRVDFSNLYALTEHYGMSVVDGIALDADPYYMASYGSPYDIVPSLSSTDPITAKVLGSKTIFGDSHAISVSDTLDSNITVSKLAVTSSYGYVVNDTEQLTEEDIIYNGECVVAALATLADTDGKFVWFASKDITDDNVDADSAGGNSKLFLSALGELCAKENSVSISGKLMDTEYLVTTEGTSLTFLVVFVAVIPVAFIAAGVVITVIRRRR